jgi:hypothetical protein
MRLETKPQITQSSVQRSEFRFSGDKTTRFPAKLIARRSGIAAAGDDRTALRWRTNKNQTQIGYKMKQQLETAGKTITTMFMTALVALGLGVNLINMATPAAASGGSGGGGGGGGGGSITVAQMVSPVPGTTLPGNDVTFTWSNVNADYFLDIESVPGAHDIFYALVSKQNFVHLLNLPTNGQTIYVTLWTQIHGQWQTPLQYTYTAASN